MEHLRSLGRFVDSWRRFHLRNWVPITISLIGSAGASLVVAFTLGLGGMAGLLVLLSIAYAFGLMPAEKLS